MVGYRYAIIALKNIITGRAVRETAYFKCTQAALLHRQYDLETTYTQLTLIHITNKSIDATVITFSPTLGWVPLYGH